MNRPVFNIPRARVTLIGLMLACFLVCTAWAEDFTPVDGAEQQQQTRRFDTGDPKALRRACLAVIQDLQFQVTESEVAPGLLVADSMGNPRGDSLHTLTISLQEVPGRSDSYQVRLSASVAPLVPTFGKIGQPDYTDFYQNFFIHLNRELFKENQP